jgi:hypothetical protein
MAKKESTGFPQMVKASHPTRPDTPYFLMEPDRQLAARLARSQTLPRTCDRPCTKLMTLLPKTKIDPHTGIGYFVLNVDGFRWINAYVISDTLFSTAQRGFTLQLSFAPNPFVYGVGVVGESNCFFSFDSYYDPGAGQHRTVVCSTDDLTSLGGLPRIGGVDLTHTLRVPVMGPYVRASVFNEDNAAHEAQVTGYLTT